MLFELFVYPDLNPELAAAILALTPKQARGLKKKYKPGSAVKVIVPPNTLEKARLNLAKYIKDKASLEKLGIKQDKRGKLRDRYGRYYGSELKPPRAFTRAASGNKGKFARKDGSYTPKAKK